MRGYRKKRIAVFAGGWGGEYLQEALCGIEEYAKEVPADIFAFVNFTVHADTLEPNLSEFNLFTLPTLTDFDGVIMLANSFNMKEELEYLTGKLKKTSVPAICMEYQVDSFPSVCSDNYAGMYDLAKHVIEEHHAKNILYIGGPEEHVENQERLKALMDVVRENGIVIPKRNICYGDWAKNLAVELVSDWLEENKSLPDAIICANDIMALAIGEWLVGEGYDIPEDVIVTGYDCIRSAMEAVPSLTSVSHEWHQLGVTTLKLLLDRINGEQISNNTVLKTKFIKGGSCGCQRMQPHKKEVGRINSKYRIDGLTSDSHFRHIYLALRRAENEADVAGSLSYMFRGEHQMEGENMMICLEPEFFRIEENDLNLRSQGYSNRLEAVCIIKDGVPLEHQSLERSQAIFYLARQRKEPGLYLFIPIYNDTKTYGFAILSGDLRIACDNQLYIWTRHMNQSMEQVRRNITIADLTRKLTELSVTDVLTGVYNRAGCEKIAYPMLEEWKQNGGTGIIMIVDVDKMKNINDHYGHAQGDLALRTVASVLKSELPKEWIVSRFGGDEFFVGGKVVLDDVDLDEIRAGIEKRLADEVERRNIVFPLTVSVGCVKVQPDETLSMERLLQKADEKMYDEKEFHHKMYMEAEE